MKLFHEQWGYLAVGLIAVLVMAYLFFRIMTLLKSK